ncbi:phosphomannomutase/phosphoglucomutase, partial [Streptomyces sp. DT225]
ELARHPGAAVIHNLITSRAVPEVIREAGGTPVRTRVGHSFIKAEMARTGAVFGGEHSAHYYFRDFWNADTGMLAALHVLAALGGQGGPLSALTRRFERYA